MISSSPNPSTREPGASWPSSPPLHPDKTECGHAASISPNGRFSGSHSALAFGRLQREGTNVVTDIVFLRNAPPGEPANYVDPEWLRPNLSPSRALRFPSTVIFCTIPRWSLAHSAARTVLRRRFQLQRHRQGDLAGQLRHAIQHLPKTCIVHAFQARRMPPLSSRPLPCSPISPKQLLCRRRPGHPAMASAARDSCHHGETPLKADGTMMGRRAG